MIDDTDWRGCAEAWQESAAQHLRNEQYYAGLLDRIGALFGDDARTADDGSVGTEVLRAKVPELVARLVQKTRGTTIQEGLLDAALALFTALHRTLVRAGVLHPSAVPELMTAAKDYTDTSPTVTEPLTAKEHPEGEKTAAARSVRSLSDHQLLTALRNVGCHVGCLLECDGCAELFFTGSRTREHTCLKGR